MRTIKHILITGCIALAVSSCDYLDQQPYEYWQPEETFIDYNKTIQMLNSVYVSMPNGYQSNYTAFLDASTDDGAYVDPANAMYKLGQGYATEISPIENRWADLYIGIRRTLYFEQYIPLLQNNAGWTDAQVESYKELAIAESKSVRALYYFELIKRYGGVPLVKKTYTLDDKEIITLPRNNFSDCVDYAMKPAKYLRATIISPINIVVLVFYQPVHARWLLRQKRWRTQRVHYSTMYKIRYSAILTETYKKGGNLLLKL